MRIAKLHLRIANIRNDFTHKTTTYLVSNYRNIGIEDLSTRNMMKNHKLAKSISDQGFYEFRRQLVYKATLSGSEIMVADRFFPSSKLCSNCGWKKEDLSLSDREWQCKCCGRVHDRDINAALNLRNVALGRGRQETPAEGPRWRPQ